MGNSTSRIRDLYCGRNGPACANSAVGLIGKDAHLSSPRHAGKCRGDASRRTSIAPLHRVVRGTPKTLHKICTFLRAETSTVDRISPLIWSSPLALSALPAPPRLAQQQARPPPPPAARERPRNQKRPPPPGALGRREFGSLRTPAARLLRRRPTRSSIELNVATHPVVSDGVIPPSSNASNEVGEL